MRSWLLTKKPIVKSWLEEIGRFGWQIIKNILGSKIEIVLPFEIKAQYTNIFTLKKLNLWGRRNFSELKPSDFDAYVVGSDQVWRPDYAGSSLNAAYLEFAKDWDGVKRIAYAVSFGLDKWTYTKEQTELCSTLAQKFDTITVCECGAVDLCRKYLKVNAQNVLDPSLLLDAEEYITLIDQDQTTKAGSNVFGYLLNGTHEINSLIKEITKKGNYTDYHIVDGGFQWSNILRRNTEQFITVTQWLRYFRDASCVITNSFHGAVFCILFNKPFVVLHNALRGNARMDSLVRTFDIEERLIVIKETDKVLKLLHTPLNTEGKLQQLRQFSLETLKKIND